MARWSDRFFWPYEIKTGPCANYHELVDTILGVPFTLEVDFRSVRRSLLVWERFDDADARQGRDHAIKPEPRCGK